MGGFFVSKKKKRAFSTRAIEFQERNREFMTPAEKICSGLLSHLKAELKFEYSPQYIFIPDMRHKDKFFLLDFFIYAPIDLAVEIDGGYHDNPEQAKYDKWRQEVVESRGIRVVRYSNEQISNDRGFVLSSLREIIKSRVATDFSTLRPKRISGKIHKPFFDKKKKWKPNKTVAPKPHRESNAPKMFKSQSELKAWFAANNAMILSESQEIGG